MRNKLMMLVIVGSLITSSIGFATTIRPTMNLLDKNASYQIFELTKEKVELTLINSRVAENQFNATLESFEKLEDKGFHIPSVQVFAVRLGLLSTVENISYSIDMMRISEETTKRSLLLGLRELYMGLYQAKESYQINDEKYQLEKDNYEMDLARFESGLLSEIGLLTSKVNSLEAYANYAESINNYRIMLETFNQYIGQDNLYEIYDLVKENPINMYYHEIDYYIDRALEMRSEVIDINRRLDIAYMKKELYEDRNGMYLRIEDINDDYIDLLNDIFELEVERDEDIQSVTLEVIDSYNEMMTAKKNVETLKATVDEQLERLEHYKLQSELGYITENTYKQVELSIRELEVNYELAVMSYNSQLYKFAFSTTAGPSAIGGR